MQNMTAGKIMLVLGLLVGEARSFVQVPSCASRAAATTALAASSSVGGGEGGAGMTRAEAIQVGCGVFAAGLLLGGSTQAQAEEGVKDEVQQFAALRGQMEKADEETKDEVQQFAELRGQVEKKGRDEVTKENLTLLADATDGLKTLDTYIGEKDYQALRLALRKPPISNLRSSARKVILGIDNKDAEEKATRAYKALITSVDKLDSIANRGMKAKEGLKDDKEIIEVYGSCVERGSDLLTLLPTIL